MFRIEITNLDGDVDTRELSKSQPLACGRHSSSDIVIDEESVAPMHCRISWNKKSFEVVAAGSDGVEVNGTMVRNSAIADGDIIRIGTVDIRVCEAADDEVELKPVDDFEPPALYPDDDFDDDEDVGDLMPNAYREQEAKSKAVEAGRSRKQKSNSKRASRAAADDDDDLDELEEWTPSANDDGDDWTEDIDVEDDAGQPVLQRSRSEEEVAQEPADAGPRESVVSSLKTKLRATQARPGEQDVLRSPLVLTLGGGSAVLLLVAATFWFIIGRETVQRQFNAANTEMEQGKYTQAITQFEKFLEKYPRHKYTEPARLKLGESKIKKQISGSTPNWPRGLDAVQTFIKDNRDSETFKDLHPILAKYGETIALGAAKTAESANQRDLLTISTAAEKLLDRFSSKDEPPVEAKAKIRQAFRQAEAALLKRETFDKEIENIDKALKQQQPMLAFAARDNLLTRYPALESDRTVRGKLQEILDAERSLITSQDVGRAAVTDERTPAGPAPLTLTLHTRSRTDEQSDGRTVITVGKDCCYGIDSVTGDPLWRRVIGLDTPFFPLRLDASVPVFMIFDTNHNELMLVVRRTGKLVWRQAIAADISGAPLIHEGQIYLSAFSGELYQIDLESGHIATILKFSQKLLAPPAALADGNHLVVAGDKSVLYTLTSRPLNCITVTYCAHKAGSVQAPLLPMGALLLMAENDRADSCRLRVFDTSEPAQPLAEKRSRRVEGQVRDAPILRGNRLFVPSSEERVAVFTVSDDPNQTTMAPVTTTQLQTPHSGAMYLSAGADGQLWMASSALRRFQLTTESIKLDTREVAAGLSSQPLQSLGDRLYLGRRLPGSGAIVFTQADKEAMVSQWKTVVGSSLLAYMPAGDDTFLCVNSTGEVFQIASKDLQAAGFKFRAESQLKLSDAMEAPLRATLLSNGRMAVHCGMPEPKLWIINPLGQIEREIELKQPLEADPILVAGRIVLPLPGKLMLAGQRIGQAHIDAFTGEVDKENPKQWVYLAAVDKTHMVVVDSTGKLTKLQYRTTPKLHLFETVSIPLGKPVDVRFVVHDGKIIVADAGGRLQILNATDMQTVSETNLDAPASNDLWLDGNLLYVETGRNKLNCLDVAQTLKNVWSLALDGESLADKPLLVGASVVVAKRSGEVLAVDPKTGKVKKRLQLGQPITLGPRQFGTSMVVGTVDGSLYRVESAMEVAE